MVVGKLIKIMKHLKGYNENKDITENIINSVKFIFADFLDDGEITMPGIAHGVQRIALRINAPSIYDFTDIYKEAWQKCKAQGQSPVIPVLGGKAVETVKFLLGWKSARWFSYHLHKQLNQANQYY